MMALVCKTVDGVMFIKSRASEGVRNRNSGLSGIGSSIGGSSEGRFRVICLDNLRYVAQCLNLFPFTMLFFSRLNLSFFPSLLCMQTICWRVCSQRPTKED